MKILKNYFYDANTDKYQLINSPYVLATEPFAIVDSEMVIREPLVVNVNGTNIVFDRESYERKNKKFYFDVNEDLSLKEVKEGEYQISIWLPKDTDVSKLRFFNGNVVMVEKESKIDKSKEN